jgi:7,8-dihydropterin-6-yl-methyl-4-(beta-D-ribofuranosyl)aminobenzene 5'-phosphate synthase
MAQRSLEGAVMKRLLPLVLGAAALLLASLGLSAQAPGVRITYLYDNTVAVQGTKSDWGFACLVEGHGRTVLFDTGARPDVLRQNMAALKVDPTKIQAVILSHEHGDHTVGMGALPAMPGLPVYIGEHFRLPLPATDAIARIGANRVTVRAGQSVQVFPGFLVSEEISGKDAYEEALIVDTPAGSVVVVGCAHPGIVAMLRRIAETTKRPIHAVIGGFHLSGTPAAEVHTIIAGFKALGVKRAGPTHCTGDEAIRLFREAYGDGFVAGGVGTVVSAPTPAAGK